MDNHQHSETGDGDTDRQQGEDEPMADMIRDSSHQHTEAEGSGPWRDRVQLCLNGAVAKRSDNGRCEVGIAIGFSGS